MQSQIVPSPTQTTPVTRSWPQAYLAFLLNPKERMVLKVAPLALMLGLPEVIASSFLPVVGELTDVGEIVLWAIVIYRTVLAVSRHKTRG
jgi:hypothetical protein